MAGNKMLEMLLSSTDDKSKTTNTTVSKPSTTSSKPAATETPKGNTMLSMLMGKDNSAPSATSTFTPDYAAAEAAEADDPKWWQFKKRWEQTQEKAYDQNKIDYVLGTPREGGYTREQIDLMVDQSNGGGTHDDYRRFLLMTPEEKQQFQYWLNKDGEEVALQYLDYIDNSLTQRYAESLSKDRTYAQDLARGVGARIRADATAVGDFLTKDYTAPTAEEYAMGLAYEKYAPEEGSNGFLGTGASAKQLGLTTSQTIASQVPAMAANAFLPGSGYAVSGLTAGGNAYRGAVAEGKDRDKAQLYGILVGATEAAVGKMLSGIGGKAGIAEEKLLPKIAKWNNALARGAATVGINIASEEAEEFIQNFGLEPLLRQWIFDEEYTAPGKEEMLQTAIVTALSSGLMSAGQTTQMVRNPQGFIDSDTNTTQQQTETTAQPQQTAAQPKSSADMVMEEAGYQNAQNPAIQPTLQETRPVAAQENVGGLTPQTEHLQTQFNIDSAATNNYTGVSNITTTMGGVANDAGRSVEADSAGVPRGDTERYADNQGRQRFGGVLGSSGRVLSERAKDAISSRGVVFAEMIDVSANSAAFSVALDEARIANGKNGWAVSPKTAQEIKESNTRVYMNSGASVGFGVAADGDIVAVFANKIKGAPQKSTMSIIPAAISAGGTKLDCYGSALARLYSLGGFAPVARVPFNPEYANPGWDESKGRPDIYFMMATDFDADSVAENYGSYKVFSDEDLAALPVMEYDEAYAYRDKLLQEAKNAVNPLPPGTGAAEAGFSSAFDQWQQQTPESGFHPVNETAAYKMMDERGRVITEVPKKNPRGQLTPKVSQTLMNAQMTPDSFVAEMQELLAQGKYGSFAYEDTTAVEAAENWIRGRGYEQALAETLADIKAGKMSKDLTTRTVMLFNAAANGGNSVDALNIASALITYSREAGRAMQAINLINKLGPSAELYSMAQSVEAWSEQLKQKLGDKAKDLSINPELAKAFLEAETDKAKEEARRDLMKDIARQMPSTWEERFQAWRYLSMLGNPRTHVRNFMGNVGFLPAREVSRILSTAIETGVDVVTGGKLTKSGGRTKAFLDKNSAEDKARIQIASADFVEVEDMIQGGGKYDENATEVEKYRRIFRNGILEWARKTNTKLLNIGDVVFSKPVYTKALASFLKANSISAEQFAAAVENNDPIVLKGRKYAIEQAQKATFRDANWLSEKLTKMRFKGDDKLTKIANTVLVEGNLPFKKTPANVLVRGLEYSPAGLAKSLVDLTYGVKTGKVTAAQAIDNFTAGMTGSAIAAIGWALAKNMMVTGGIGDDEEDKFRLMRGEQGYAFVIGDKSYTIDWLAPAALPFFVGVELYNLKADGDLSDAQAVEEALKRLSEPMLELSMLQSLNDAFDAIEYSDNKLVAFIASGATNYLSQFIPTFGGQVERAFLEDKRQTFYADRESSLDSDTQYLLYQAANKIPIPRVEYGAIDYIDAWGRTESTGSTGERVVENFFSPGYLSEDRSTSVDDELQRLYDAGYGDSYDILPSRPNSSTQIKWTDKDGNAHTEYLSAEEYVLYATTRGQTSLELLTEFMESDAYEKMTDKERAAYVDRVYKYATEIAKDTVHPEFAESEWVTAAAESGSAADYIYMVSRYGTDAIGGHYADLTSNGLDMATSGVVFTAVEDTRAEAEAKGAKAKDIDYVRNFNGLDLTDEEKLAATMEYTGDGKATGGMYKRYEAAINAGFTYEEWTNITLDIWALPQPTDSDPDNTAGLAPSQKTLRAYLDKHYADDPETARRIWNIYKDARNWEANY